MRSPSASQMSFVVWAGIDCLWSPINLCRWWIQSHPTCPLSHTWPCTVNHILNCCPTALNQERYTWWHLSWTTHPNLQLYLPEDGTLYTDLPGLRASDNPPLTRLYPPPSYELDSARPDIVRKEHPNSLFQTSICPIEWYRDTQAMTYFLLLQSQTQSTYPAESIRDPESSQGFSGHVVRGTVS